MRSCTTLRLPVLQLELQCRRELPAQSPLRGDVAQPAAMNSAFVSNNGAATNSSMLKISAKTIEPRPQPSCLSSVRPASVSASAPGIRPGTAPVNPAKSPSPSITAGESATFTSLALSFFSFRKRFVGGVIERLDSESHRLNQHGAAAQHGQLQYRILIAPFGRRAAVLTMVPSALRTAIA